MKSFNGLLHFSFLSGVFSSSSALDLLPLDVPDDMSLSFNLLVANVGLGEDVQILLEPLVL